MAKKNKKGTVKDVIPGQKANPVILLFLLLSGSCGLVYEILWMKMLTLVIGNTVFSITTVLTAFMGGLALGSFLAGRFIDKIKNPLRAYGLLEGGIGVYALLLPVLIAGAEPLFRFVYQGLNPSFYTFGLLRFVVCVTLLLVPTTLMGATLPVLSQYFVAGQTNLGRNVGLLYGMNTFGAVLGCSLAGFVLIPALGVTWTIYGAALLNLAICAGVLKLANIPVQREQFCGDKEITKGKKQKKQQKKQQRQKQEMHKKSVQEVVPEIRPAVVRAVMAAVGVSGLAAMVFQIAWTRVLSLSIGSSVYAFSLIVTAFICGLALGSLAIAKFIDRRRDLVLWLALAQAAIGISALGIVPLFGKLPIFLAESVFEDSHSFQYIHFAEFAVIFGLILVPTFLMGAAVPMAVKICTPDAGRVGRFFGNVYAANTLGAIIGSFLAGFILIPWLGTQNSISIAVALNILTAGLLFFWAPSLGLPLRMAGAAATVVIALAAWYPIAPWDANVLSSGAYLYFDEYKAISNQKGIGLATAMRDRGQLLYFKEGLHALVSVEKTALGDVVLDVNGKADASAKGMDVATQLMLGHLPLLLHQNAEDVLLIGLGSGMTLGAVAQHPVKTVDVVEIEPAVVEASRYFREFTGDVLDDPRANLIVADGRNHVALTNRQYDVIISEPSNPWVAGMANLFTREFFDAAKKRLKTEGLMCQWVDAYAMSEMDFKTIVSTFQAVFPHVTLWEATLLGGDYLLIGSRRAAHIDPGTLTKRLGDGRMKVHLERMHIRGPAAFMGKLILTGEAIPDFIAGAPLHTDGNARLEYSAPRAVLWSQSTRLLEELYQFRSKPADVLRSLRWSAGDAQTENGLSAMFQGRMDVLAGYSQYKKGAAPAAKARFEHALALNPDDFDAAYLLAELHFKFANLLRETERPAAETARAYAKSVEVIENFIRGDRALLTDHFKLDVFYAKANLYLGTLAFNQNRPEQAVDFLTKSISGEVRYASAHNNLGIAFESMGRYDAAVAHYQRAIELNPGNFSAYMNMGNTRLKQKRYPEAIESYHQAEKLRPDSARAHFSLGSVYFRQKEWERAEKEWTRTLELKPDFKQARQGLAAVRKKMGSQ